MSSKEKYAGLAGRTLVGLTAAALAAGTGAQVASAEHHLTRVTGTVKHAIPVSKEIQSVVLKLAGDPVAVARSLAPGKHISESARQGIVRNLRARQDAITPGIRAAGGEVLAKYQHAINGIKVRGTPAQIAAMAKLPGVIDVKGVRSYHLLNAESVPFIGAPAAWQGPPGLHGEHVKVAIIDTGVDYTHANFGGPGTVAAFNTAFASSTLPADPTVFGPGAPKVKGGTDLVGDDYNADPTSASYQPTPHPDPNPLDCNGHGSHTAGTATGFGVTAAGTTYGGPYDASTPTVPFTIGPGVAPLADLYAVRVFGCAGSTDVVVDAIDWSIANDMQVISMSLGSDYGTATDADAEASENAVNAGVVVVAASGNAGPGAYMTSDPASGDKVISVAAVDSHQSFPAETLTLAPAGSIDAIDANGIALADGTSLPIVILPDTLGTGSNGVSLGCDPAEYTAANVTGKIVVTVRGTCARVDRAIYGQQAGAAAVIMINNAAGYPPYEGPINSNPDTGAAYTVTIPFLGVQAGASTDPATLVASASATLAASSIANPTFRSFASFSSAGPRTGDGYLKPDISAPGVSVFSTASGTGNQGMFDSGTSMATPHVAGSAALAIQAHPGWDADQVATAVVNTADATQVAGYSPRKGGNGLVQPYAATRTSVIARAAGGAPSLSFGVVEFTKDFKGDGYITVENHGNAAATFAVSVAPGPGVPHTATVDSKFVTVGGHRSRSLHVRLAVPVATTGDSSALRQAQGQIVLTPTAGNQGVALSVPYYLVARARSLVQAKLTGSLRRGTGAVQVSNRSATVAGTADFYALGERGFNANMGAAGLRAVGVQSFNDPSFGQMLVFAINTYGRPSNPASTVYDVLVDVNGDGIPDFDIESSDLGGLTTGSNNGTAVVAVFDLNAGGAFLEFLTTAPTDGTTVLLPVVAADIGITSASPRFSYVTQTLDLATGNADAITTPAGFNAFNNALSTGGFAVLAPGGSASVPLVLDPVESKLTPALGAMVVSEENFARGNAQALLVPLSD